MSSFASAKFNLIVRHTRSRGRAIHPQTKCVDLYCKLVELHSRQALLPQGRNRRRSPLRDFPRDSDSAVWPTVTTLNVAPPATRGIYYRVDVGSLRQAGGGVGDEDFERDENLYFLGSIADCLSASRAHQRTRRPRGLLAACEVSVPTADGRTHDPCLVPVYSKKFSYNPTIENVHYAHRRGSSVADFVETSLVRKDLVGNEAATKELMEKLTCLPQAIYLRRVESDYALPPTQRESQKSR